MAITATSESAGNGYQIPSGTHIARCFEMIELGTITEPYMGEMKTAKKIRISWELPLETKTFNGIEKPLVISSMYSLSMHEKSTLRKTLESWRGRAFTEAEVKAFDVTKLLGVPCMVTVLNEQKGDKTFSKVTGVSSIPKGLTCPSQFNPSFILSYDDFDIEKFNKLPKFIKDKMMLSAEFKKISDSLNGEHHINIINSIEDNNEDLPF